MRAGPLLLLALTPSLRAQVGHRAVGINCYENGRYVYYDGLSTCPAAAAAPQPSAATLQGMDPVFQSAAGALSGAIAGGITRLLSNPGASPAAVQAAKRRAEEQELRRFADEQRAAAERQATFQRLSLQLKLDGAPGLSMKGFAGGPEIGSAGNAGGLAFKTSEDPGFGGAAEPEAERARRGAALARLAADAGEAERRVLLDQALAAANGDASVFIPAARLGQPLPEDGLRAFQLANKAYRKARDLRVKHMELFNAAQERREAARRVLDASAAQYRLAAEAAQDRESRRAAFIKLLEATRREEELLGIAQGRLDLSGVEVELAAFQAKRVLLAAARGDVQPPVDSDLELIFAELRAPESAATWARAAVQTPRDADSALRPKSPRYEERLARRDAALNEAWMRGFDRLSEAREPILLRAIIGTKDPAADARDMERVARIQREMISERERILDSFEKPKD